MDNPILDFSVALAKPMELVREHEALRAHFSGAIASARARLDDERSVRVRSLPATGDTEMPAPRRQRKRSLAKVCEAARKAGADRVIVDGVVIVLSPAAVPESNGNEFDAWMAKHAH
jgi:hypothetical protein